MDSTTADTSNPVVTIIFLIVGGFVYVLPILVARSRKTVNKGAVAVVAVLLGWTCLGWIIALAMAAGGTTEGQAVARTSRSAPVLSPDGKSWWDGQRWRPMQ